jgi:hypothetical protein
MADIHARIAGAANIPGYMKSDTDGNFAAKVGKWRHS